METQEAPRQQDRASSGPGPYKRASRKGAPRRFACEYPSCDKIYSRAEHLQRHRLNRARYPFFAPSPSSLPASLPLSRLPSRLPPLMVPRADESAQMCPRRSTVATLLGYANHLPSLSNSLSQPRPLPLIANFIVTSTTTHQHQHHHPLASPPPTPRNPDHGDEQGLTY